jgi:16S rRNA (cytidine1402-2'-O)-methyltransferase
MGTLYLVATPIGNLEDITLRALRTLQEVRLIAAEDTRRTGRLLAHFKIETPQTSYFEHNKLVKITRILQALAEGDVALVSDAGMPGLNDPGYELVRAALQAGYPVSPVPGPSAPLAALVSSGLPADSFLYLGYLPRKSTERQQLLQQVCELPHTLVFLETPHRLLAALGDLQAVLGDRQAAVARELTKLHEEIRRGPISEQAAYFKDHPPRGEFTLVVAGHHLETPRWPERKLQAALEQALAGETPLSQAAGELAAESGWPRREIYQRLVALKGE